MWRYSKLTTKPTDPGPSKNANVQSSVDQLIRDSKRYKNREEFITFLVSQMKASSPPAYDLEYIVGTLRVAVGEYFQNRTSEAFGNRCHFCGRPQTDVRTVVASAESSICDECVLLGLETVCNRRGYFHLRIAFLIFRSVASVGYFIAYVFAAIASVGYRLIHWKN